MSPSKLQKDTMRNLMPVFAALFAASSAFAASPLSSETLPSGVVIEKSKTANGAMPKATDIVKVHYRGTLQNGTEFDSSYARNVPASFPLGAVIPCWTQGLQKLHVGEKARLTCPPATAYAAQGVPGKIAPNSTLYFDVELLAIGLQ
jgi:FKBP-type peptidyl-prolyl cis-trans isomerase FkpA